MLSISNPMTHISKETTIGISLCYVAVITKAILLKDWGYPPLYVFPVFATIGYLIVRWQIKKMNKKFNQKVQDEMARKNETLS